MARGVNGFFSEDTHAGGGRFPAEEWFVIMEFGARLDGELEVGLDGELGKEDAGARLPNGDGVVRKVESGELLVCLGGGQHAVGQVMFGGATNGAGDENAVGRADHEAASLMKELAAGGFFQGVP